MEAAANTRMSDHEPTIISQPSELENAVSRLFHAPQDRVFHLFTDLETLPYVFAPDPKRVTVEKLDFRPGGSYSILVHMDDGTPMRFHGTYLEVSPPRRVVNTFEVSSTPGVVAVETDEFEKVGDFTRVTVRWKFPSREDRDKMAGPEMEAAVETMWNNAAALLGSP